MSRVDVFAIDTLTPRDLFEVPDPAQSVAEMFPRVGRSTIEVYWSRVRIPEIKMVLSDEERARAQSIRNDSDRLTYAFAHTALRRRVSEDFGIQPDVVKFQTGRYGRPYLDGCTAGLFFSLSYRRGLVAIATGRRPIGVDIEYVDDSFPYMHVGNRYFTPSEALALRKLSMDLQPYAFFDLWTRKEAVIKAAGVRLHDGLECNVSGPSVLLTDENHVTAHYDLETIMSNRRLSLSVALRKKK
jgi:phosphopantetheinyl transferase